MFVGKGCSVDTWNYYYCTIVTERPREHSLEYRVSSQVLCSQVCAGVNELNLAGETPLHVACRLGKAETARALLGGGARSDIIGGAGYPIHMAMKYSSKE